MNQSINQQSISFLLSDPGSEQQTLVIRALSCWTTLRNSEFEKLRKGQSWQRKNVPVETISSEAS